MSVDRRNVLLGAAALAAAPVRAAPARSSRFLWGAATAAHQIEGANANSDYWVLEHIPSTYFREPSGDACDSWNRWREDLELVRAGGMNAYRFSIEWARIEPERGEYSLAALDHYRSICLAARDMGIEPVVTLHHFTSPRWFAGRGGWQNPAAVDDYARYAERATRALRDVLGFVCTFNEPNAQVTSKVVVHDKPWDKEPSVLSEAARAVGTDRWGAFFLGDPYRARDTIIDAHRKARVGIRAAAPQVRLGLTLALQDNRAAPGGEALLRRIQDEARAPFYAVARDDDFIGVQTYNVGAIGPDGYQRTTTATMRDATGNDSSPTALRATIREAHQATGRPVFVTENGINATDDALRVRHLRDTVLGLAEEIDAGLPVLGYMHWSLIDNFEWSSGWVPRFGLCSIDRNTFRRTPKPSLAAYRTIIAQMRAKHRWA